MHKILSAFLIGAFFALPVTSHANVLEHDSSDPLYILAQEEVLSQTYVTYWNNMLRVGQSLSYGLNERLSIGANVHYQHHFNGNKDGFSAIDLGATYRMTRANDTESHVISDLLFGFKFGGSSHARTPYYANSTYYAGLRIGRQWAGMTLAATIKSSWVFDDERGMSFIDFMPEAYFRIAQDWRIGGGFTIRKATNHDALTGDDYDQEWLHTKLVRQFGRTQYIGHIDYEFEEDEIQFGAKVNIIF